MFYIGLILLILGAIIVYRNDKVGLKGGGLLIAVIGTGLVLFSEFPKELESLRFIKRFLKF